MLIVNSLLLEFNKIGITFIKKDMDLRFWKIFRALLSLFYFIVGLAEFSNMEDPNIIAKKMAATAKTEKYNLEDKV